MAQEPILCFDGDDAGQRAAARAAERALPLLKPGLPLRFAWMPAGRGSGFPGPGQGRGRLPRGTGAGRSPWSTCCGDQVLADRPLDTPERRAGFRSDLAEAVARIADKAVADAYRQETHRRLDDLFRPQPKPAFQGG